jgi:hypothetical protein
MTKCTLNEELEKQRIINLNHSDCEKIINDLKRKIERSEKCTFLFFKNSLRKICINKLIFKCKKKYK